mgnify:CR=1 FL=1
MSIYMRKSSPKSKGFKSIRLTKPSGDWGRLGFDVKEKTTVSIEETRRQGLRLAGRQLEQGARSRSKVPEESESRDKKGRASSRKESPW